MAQYELATVYLTLLRRSLVRKSESILSYVPLGGNSIDNMFLLGVTILTILLP